MEPYKTEYLFKGKKIYCPDGNNARHIKKTLYLLKAEICLKCIFPQVPCDCVLAGYNAVQNSYPRMFYFNFL